MAATGEKAGAKLEELPDAQQRIVELSESNDDAQYEDAQDESRSEGLALPGKHLKPRHPRRLPPWLAPAILDLPQDTLQTTTSEAQAKTLSECLPFLTGSNPDALPLNSHGLPALRRKAHIAFLHATLNPLPAPYAVLDASRPWVFYWAVQGLSTLGDDVSKYKQRLKDTVRPLQHPDGGFGGGHSQHAHCAATYATVLALAIVDGLDVVDRRAMWRWLGAMKRGNGGFAMAKGAEVDIRGAFCAVVILTLLNLPLELPPDCEARRAGLRWFTDGLGEWVGRCQSWEGGIAGVPDSEAHGAYAFCALGCLSIMGPPAETIPKYLDVGALLRWLSAMQTSPEGGFAGRTNKLVDACYSHWVGGCWSLLEAALGVPKGSGVWRRQGLIRYLLCCCQQPGKRGGMRDKPSARPDGYHTNYSLTGLSAAMHHYTYEGRVGATNGTREGEAGRLMAAFQWTAQRASEEERREWEFDQGDEVDTVHPVFVLPFAAVERVKRQFAEGGF